MNNLEKQLNELPSYRLGFLKSLKISLNISYLSLTKLINLNTMSKVQTFAASAVAVLVILGGTTAYAYNSPSVTVGDSMYSLKMAAESVRVSLADNGLGEVKAQLINAERRVAEARYLASSDSVKPLKTAFINTAFAQDAVVEVPTNFSETLDAVIATTDAAILTAETISDASEAEEALISIEESQEVQKEGLNEIASVVDLANPETTTAVSAALAETEENQAAIAAAQTAVTAAIDGGETEVDVEVETVAKKERKLKLSLEEITALQASYAEKKADMIAGLTAAGISAEDTARLNEKLTAMEAKVSEAIAAGNYNQAKGLIKASIALQNNAKHFIKKVELKEDRDELKKETEEKVKEIRSEHKKKRDDLKQRRDEKRDVKKDLKENSELKDEDNNDLDKSEDLDDDKDEVEVKNTDTSDDSKDDEDEDDKDKNEIED